LDSKRYMALPVLTYATSILVASVNAMIRPLSLDDSPPVE